MKGAVGMLGSVGVTPLRAPAGVRRRAGPAARALGDAADADARANAAFHLSVPTHDLGAARRFYGDVLGCEEGRSTARWVDYNLAGHQLVLHLVEGFDAASFQSSVDADPVPIPHFGLALSVAAWEDLVERLRAHGVQWGMEPHVRFEGQPGEQRVCFVRDESGNALEFKAMTVPENLFARYDAS